MIRILGLAVAAFLVGSLPSAQLVIRLAPRVPARAARIVALLLDAVKGLIAMSFAGAGANSYAQALAATAVVAGHQWPVWRNAPRGDAGLVTAAAALSAVTPLAVPVWCVLWAAAYVASGYLALGSAAATLLLPPVLGFVAGWPFAWVVLPACLLVLERHRREMRRILLGTESKHYWRNEG